MMTSRAIATPWSFAASRAFHASTLEQKRSLAINAFHRGYMGMATSTIVTSSGRSAWFNGVVLIVIYLIFAITLYLLPPAPV